MCDCDNKHAVFESLSVTLPSGTTRQAVVEVWSWRCAERRITSYKYLTPMSLLTRSLMAVAALQYLSYHSWTLLSKHQHYRGMGTLLALHILFFLPLKAAILSHMTSKLFTQTKDNEMYKCIKFHLLIP